MRGEISYDLVMEDDMSFVEGTYRLPGGAWQVVIFSAFERDVPEPEVIPQVWDSGVTGVFVRFPRHEQINQAAVEQGAVSCGSGVTGVGPGPRPRLHADAVAMTRLHVV